MTQFSNLSLEDSNGDATPFNVQGINYTNGVATWKNAGTSFDAGRFLSLSIATPSAKTTRARVKAKVTIPIMDVIDTAKKVDELICNVEFVLPKTSTLTARNDLLVFVKEFLTKDPLANAVLSFEGVY